MLPPVLVTARCASGYMLETPSIPRYSLANLPAVTMRRVRTISRKGPFAFERESSETIRQMPSEIEGDEMVPSAWRHAGSHIERSVIPFGISVRKGQCPNKTISEIPCRVSSDLHEWRNDLGAVSSRDPVKL